MAWTLRLLGWALATALLVACFGALDWRQLREALVLMRWRWVALALLANAAILFLRTGLWWTVAPRRERPRYRTMFEINAAASGLMNTIPLLGGHAAAVLLLIKRGGLTQHEALSVLALDQLGEGLAKVTIFALVAVGAPIPDWMRLGIGLTCVGVGALLLALVAAAHWHLRLNPPDRGVGSIVQLRAHLAEWASRMETLRSARQSVWALVFAIGTKIAEGAGLLAVQHALGVTLPFGATALVLAAVVLGSMVPVAPANLGAYEAGAFLAYRHLGIGPDLAALLAVAAHLAFLVPSVGTGYVIGMGNLAGLRRSASRKTLTARTVRSRSSSRHGRGR